MATASGSAAERGHLSIVMDTGDDAPDDDGSADLHPLGPVGAAFDKVVDKAWEPLRGNPNLDRLFYTASELADFSLLWHLAGTARGVVRRNGHREAIRLSAALGAESAFVNGAV